MTAQVLFAQAAISTFLAAALVVSLLVVQWRVAAPLVVFGAMVLVGRACGFALNYFAVGGDAPAVVQVLNYHARSVPIIVLTIA